MIMKGLPYSSNASDMAATEAAGETAACYGVRGGGRGVVCGVAAVMSVVRCLVNGGVEKVDDGDEEGNL